MSDMKFIGKLKGVMFLDADDFAQQMHRDDELGLSKHVSIPIVKGKYQEAEVIFTLDGDEKEYTDVQELKAAVYADEARYAVIVKRNQEAQEKGE